MDTWTFWDDASGCLIVQAPSWYLARECARSHMALPPVRWLMTPDASPDIVSRWEGCASRTGSDLRLETEDLRIPVRSEVEAIVVLG